MAPSCAKTSERQGQGAGGAKNFHDGQQHKEGSKMTYQSLPVTLYRSLYIILQTPV